MRNTEAYPDRDPETARPFRVWDPQEGRYVTGRWYITEKRAHDAALVLIRWPPYNRIGAALEVLDIRKMEWRGSYSRTLDTIRIETLRKVIDNERSVQQPEQRQAASA